jgi:methylated-DNA-[protein]-cysteine S-methyltransferase
MKPRRLDSETELSEQIRTAAGAPSASAVQHSRSLVQEWFAKTAATINWGKIPSPLGPLFIAVSPQGVCAIEFGRGEGEFLRHLDPVARLQKNPQSVQQAAAELDEYFRGRRSKFDMPVDLSSLTRFQRSVLETACRIHCGEVWTYQRVAREMGRPKSSRPVGQALAHNPIPIVIPCHRVIASDGSLGGYSGGSGLEAKRWLLHLEGALL